MACEASGELGSVGTFAALAAAAERGGEPELADWLMAGVQGWLAGERFEDALGLPPNARYRFRLRERDDALRAAWAAVSPDPTLSARSRALLLHAAAGRFEAGLWPRLRQREAAPLGLNPVQIALWRALRTGLEMPGPRRLIDLCNARPV